MAQQQGEKLKVDVTEPAKVGDTWSAVVVATVSRGNQTVEDIPLVFYCDGVEVTTATTDAEGRATTEVVGLKSGTRTFEVKISGKSSSAIVRKLVKDAVPTKVTNPLTYTIFSCGKTMKIQFSLYVGGKPIVGKKIRMQNCNGGAVTDAETDTDGLALINVTMIDQHEIFRAMVLGMNVTKVIHLYK